jgi:tetratricopeptide (TPR) repeat protein
MKLLFQWLIAAAASGALAAAPGPGVKVWQGTLPLPTYQEGLPDMNAPFDLFSPRKVNYPYTLRDHLTGEKHTVNWRAVFLENEYLKCSVLPDLGGHLYTCIDKLSGQPMFYANPSIKKALVGLRGAWAAFGIEFNFPVSHNWASISPVDFAFAAHPDGSASVTIGNTDRVYGMRWNVELILRPRSTVLEERVSLENTSNVRRRFYWWNNAAVQAWEDSRIEYPMRFTEGHGLSDIDTWPVNSKGVDLSLMSNQKFGPVSRFVHGSREPFMGVYHPHTNTGVVHFANYDQLPSKKIWSWGEDADGLTWRTTLSDNDSAYVEVQAGLFRNQETYRFLDPGQNIRFEEYWMPVRGTGGITRANLNGVVAMRREKQDDGKVTLRVALNVNQAVDQAQLRITDGGTTLWEGKEQLTPKTTWSHEIKDLNAGHKYTFELLNASGEKLLAHTEGGYDWTPSGEIQVGPIAKEKWPPESQWTAADFLKKGDEQERDGRRVEAWITYDSAIQRFPQDPGLRKARGMLAVALLRYEDARADLSQAQPDSEVHYYAGLSEEALGNPEKAREHFEAAAEDRKLAAAAQVQLAELSARGRDYQKAEAALKAAREAAPESERAMEESVAVLRAAHATAQRRALLRDAAKQFPGNSLLRYERTLDGTKDEGLWMHLGADADRVLNLASTYLRLGMSDDAIALLRRRYPAVPPEQREPGEPSPQDDPRAGYLLAYAVQNSRKGDAAPLWKAASEMRVRFVFPNRAEMLPVLKMAIEKNARDATAHFLLGSLLFSRGIVKPALAEWQQAREINPKLPGLHYSLARALFTVEHKPEEAAAIYKEGIEEDPGNSGLYLGLNQLMKSRHEPASARAAMMKRYPSAAAMPEPLVRMLVATLREAGENEEANQWIRTHHFSRAEGGAPPPVVSAAPAADTAQTSSEKDVIQSLRAPRDADPIPDPANPFWKDVPAVASDLNQFGNVQPGGKTVFRSRWTDGYLYFLFVCPYQTLYLKPNPQTTGDTVGLWDWDVAEVFLGSDFTDIKKYKEFEVSPRGEWVDLDIDLDSRNNDGWKWNSGFQVAARIDEKEKVWYGAMKIPYRAIDSREPKAGLTLRANLYRIEGGEPDRKYICWQPTHSPTFHMPVAFGTLRLIE